MPTSEHGTVYAYNGRPQGSTVAVKVGNKVVRFSTDESWEVGEEVLVEVRRPNELDDPDTLQPVVPALEGFSIDG